MRVLVVEDEIAIREGLINYIERNTQHEVIGSASDGIAGLELIRTLHPDTVITDICMPHMDGLEMLQRASDNNLTPGAVILSGYSEFEYAQRAISLGVREYLLKPVDTHKLSAILEKLASSLSSGTATEQQLLWSFLTGHGDEKELNRKRFLLKQPLFASGRILLYLLLPVHCTGSQLNSLAEQMNKDLTRSIMDPFVFISLVDACLIAFPGDTQHEHIDRILRSRVIGTMEDEQCVFVRRSCNGMESMTEEIALMRSMSEHVFELGCKDVISEEKIAAFEPAPFGGITEVLTALGSALLGGKVREIDETVELFKNKLLRAKTGRGEILQAMLRFSNAVCGNGTALAEEYACMVAASKTMSDMLAVFEKLRSLAVCAADAELSQDNAIVSLVLREIRLHYDSPLSLSTLSEKAGVTSEYLSRLFTRETGVNLVSFIKTTRIENAKKLLEAGKEKIRDIAAQTGFADPKYFNRIFKEETGMTPSEYQTIHRIIP